jgi:steroid 5-alpha reductase family enzyme
MIAILLTLAALLAFMAIGWAVQRRLQNGGWTDVFWTFGTGAAAVFWALWPGPASVRQWITAALAGIWSLRLGSHIARRVAGSGEDARYAELRGAWGGGFQRRMLGFLLAQAPAGLILAVAVGVAAHNPAPFGRPADLAGLALALAGLAGESLADAQLAQFKANPVNAGKIADRGLWAWSRHPNYFFEWLIWTAYAPIAVGSDYPRGWWSLAAPALMFVLLNYVTGVPPLERSMRRTRGVAFDAYRARTSRFVPIPPRLKVSL